VRLELTHKFVLGFVLVAGVSVALPPILERLGVPFWGALFAALFVASAVASVVSRQITRNFGSLRACTDRIRNGDLTAAVDLEGGRLFPDETVDLARSVRGMLEDLRNLVEHIQSAADGVAQTARELEVSAHEANATNQEIASTMDVISHGAGRQQGAIEDTCARIREIEAAIRENAGAAREAFGFAAEARERATGGGDASVLAINQMQQMFEEVEEAGQLVFRFEEKIRSVHRIAEMITSVAEKTHLLSLNASIEAARAGDAGRGFSVVAGEIRKLAESTAGSAEQIEELIGQLDTELSHISRVMRSIGDGVSHGRGDLDTVTRSLEQIQGSINEVTQRSEAIFHEADQQVGRVEETVAHVDGISSIARENAKATEDMRSGLAAQTESMERTVNQATVLSETAARLDDVARRFRTRN
jgi:methyl-accepting chemotaxis protein